MVFDRFFPLPLVSKRVSNFTVSSLRSSRLCDLCHIILLFFPSLSSSCSICSCCGEEDIADDGCVYTGRTFSTSALSQTITTPQSSQKSSPHLPPLWRSPSLITCTLLLGRKNCVQMLTCFNWFAHIYFSSYDKTTYSLIIYFTQYLKKMRFLIISLVPKKMHKIDQKWE